MLERWWNDVALYFRTHVIELWICVLLCAFFFVMLLPRILYTIPAGHVGVIWKRFGGGTDLCRTIGEGSGFVQPWDTVYVYDTRLQQQDQTLDVLSKDGLTLTVNIAYRYELYADTVPILHQYVGPDYETVLVGSSIAARARDRISENTPDEIYSGRRSQLQSDIMASVQGDLSARFNPINRQLPTPTPTPAAPPASSAPGVAPLQAAAPSAEPVATPNAEPVQTLPLDLGWCRPTATAVTWIKLEDVLIRSIKLPRSVETAINSKNEEAQLNDEYDFRLLREAKESKRKQVEAQGIADFNRTVAAGLTAPYLRWRGIEATLELAKSPNAKVVVIGSGRDGLPIILGNDTSPAAAAGLVPAPLGQSPGPSAAVPVSEGAAASAAGAGSASAGTTPLGARRAATAGAAATVPPKR